MKTTTTKMSTILAVITLLSANVALAGGHKFSMSGGGNGGGGSSNKTMSRSMNSVNLNSFKLNSSKLNASRSISSVNLNNHSNSNLKFNTGVKFNSQINKNFNGNNYVNGSKLHIVDIKKDKDCHDYDKNCHDGYCKPYFDYYWYLKHNYCTPVYVRPCPVLLYTCQSYEPFHCWSTVLPGDSLYAISLREYGVSGAQSYIARYNGLSLTTQLVAGQRIMLPSVSASGVLSASNAPAPIGSIAPVAVEKPAVEEALTKVGMGSTLMLEGQAFGDKQGSARLAVSGLALPVEVVEWTTTSVKIRLPQTELTAATNATIEVLRADGTIASSSPVELTPATDKLAATK